ncbi:MAG: hypothetical protein HOP21_10655 [Methylotenera sp.]|nr:hypothetical protein [Methylotenera sp.]
MAQQKEIIERYLADLPDLVTPESLALKLGLNSKAIYQRLWIQKKQPHRVGLLPPRFYIPGSDRVYFERGEVIEWWITARNRLIEDTPPPKRRGRQTITEKIQQQRG